MAEMTQDDHKQSGNSSYGNNKSSKKNKSKKVPQRGLGVAQLEKIRLAEQQKSDVIAIQNSPTPILAQNYVPSIDQTSSKSPVFNANHGLSDPFLAKKPMNMGFGSLGKMWNGEQILEGQSFNSNNNNYYYNSFDQSGRFGLRPNSGFVYDSTPVLPASNEIPRKEFFQQLDSCTPMMKASSGTSSFNRNEPPSNQSFYTKLLTSSKWADEEKMIGIKRSYPFSRENPPGPAFPCRYPVAHDQYPMFRSPELPPRGSGGMPHVETRKPLLNFKEGPASSNAMSEMRRQEKGELNGDFLTLALPKPPEPNPELSESRQELQGNVDGPNVYNFFSSSNGEGTNTNSDVSEGDQVQKLDLNLKL